MFLNKKKLFLNAVLLLSIFALFAAYFIEFFLGHKPCNLCLVERVPYFISIILISLFLAFDKYEKHLLFFLGLVFAVGAIISFYHFGIEQGFFSESLVCKLSGNPTDLSPEDLLKELKKSTISCKDVTFTLFGFSLATFNTIISLAISVIMFKKFFNYDKNK